MKTSVFALVLFLILAASASAQLLPASAHVNLYVPHLIDGGPAEAQWQTTFKFVNPHAKPVQVTVIFHNDSGAPLALDFGEGPKAQIELVIPARGSRVLQSRMASGTTVSGWAEAYALLPVQATAAYRMIQNGNAVVEITAEPTLPSRSFTAAATRWMGLAVANVYATRPITVDAQVWDGEGKFLGAGSIDVPALGHKAANLLELVSELPGDLNGTVTLQGGNDDFLAWAVASDGVAISSLPPGRQAWPVSHWDRIWKVYSLVEEAAQDVLDSLQIPVSVKNPPVRLNISDAKNINAQASSDGQILVTFALSELISDSPSELAFVLAHELGHIVQFRAGQEIFNAGEPELDADLLGMLFALSSGFDPYAGAGALAKVSMAYNSAGLVTQYLKDHYDIHRSEGTRISNMYGALQAMCANPNFGNACVLYKGLVHPHFPDEVPLGAPGSPATAEPRRERPRLAPAIQ